MRVITNTAKGVTVHWPRDMRADHMIRVLTRLACDELVKDWSYVAGKWGDSGHFEIKSLDGTDSGALLEREKIFVSRSVVKELGVSQRNWLEHGAVEYGPRELVVARVYNPSEVDDLQSLVMFGHEVTIEKGGVLVNGHSVLNSLVIEFLGREGEDRTRYLGWVNDEDYWLKEIVGVGEKILPADCFGHPIVSKEG